MWNFRRKHLAASVSPDKPQLGRTPRLAAGEPPGCELVPFTFDRSAAVAQIDELTHRTEAATPFAGPTGTLAQLIAGDPEREVAFDILYRVVSRIGVKGVDGIIPSSPARPP